MLVAVFFNERISLARKSRGMMVVQLLGKYAGNNHFQRVDGWKVPMGRVFLPCDH